MRNNVPVDLAFQLDDRTRKAWCIIFREQDGASFNWNTMEFNKDGA